MAELLPHELRRRTKVGRVVSNKMQKTVVVSVESVHRHRLYKHTIRTTKRYKAHDENNESREGDKVAISPCRPLSRRKSYKLVKVLERAS